MNPISAKTALLLIDVQKGFNDASWGLRNNPLAEQVIANLLKAWRQTKRPVLHVQHLSKSASSPLHPENAGSGFKPESQPIDGEPIFRKQVNSAFIGTDLEQALRSQGIDSVVIVGLTTPHCVSTTARMAANLGFQVFLPKDAIAAFEITGPDGALYSADTVHNVSLATLHNEFAVITDSQRLLDSVDLA